MNHLQPFVTRNEQARIADRVYVDQGGRITLNGVELNQLEARDLALGLTAAIRASLDRNQIGTPGYNRTERIIERDESNQGRAMHYLRKIYGDPGLPNV